LLITFAMWCCPCCKFDAQPTNAPRDNSAIGWSLKGSHVLIHGQSVTGHGTVIANAALLQTRSYWEIRVLSLGDIWVGVAARSKIELDKPLGERSDSWGVHIPARTLATAPIDVAAKSTSAASAPSPVLSSRSDTSPSVPASITIHPATVSSITTTATATVPTKSTSTAPPPANANSASVFYSPTSSSDSSSSSPQSCQRGDIIGVSYDLSEVRPRLEFRFNGVLLDQFTVRDVRGDVYPAVSVHRGGSVEGCFSAPFRHAIPDLFEAIMLSRSVI